MKTAFKLTILRTFLSNKTRFLANFLIAFLSFVFTGGLTALPQVVEDAYLTNYEYAPDIILKNVTEDGFSEDDLNEVLESNDNVEARLLFSYDYKDTSSGLVYRLYIEDLHSDIAKLELQEGDFPSENYSLSSPLQALTETSNVTNFHHYKVGDEFAISLDLSSYISLPINLNLDIEITGIVDSPLYNSSQKEDALITDDDGELVGEYIDAIIYLDSGLFTNTSILGINVLDYLPQTDMYIEYDNSVTPKLFSSKYKKMMNNEKETYLTNYSFSDNIEVLTLEENTSYALFENYTNKITKISYLFPFFFIILCALINLITITRLIKDERSMIATYVSLGVNKMKITAKYLLFSVISVSVGALSGFIIGTPLLPMVTYDAFGAVYQLTSLGVHWGNWYGYVCILLVILATLIVTIYSASTYLKESPSSLMHEKSPKPGRKIFLEKIPLIWNALAFRFKSSFRNIFRQPKNFCLTLLSVFGATFLVLFGLSLNDNAKFYKSDPLYGNLASSMVAISIVIVVFAMAMAITVIFALASMNIADRKREIATLKVLGYRDYECSLYTFREIMIIAFISIVISLPLSALLCNFALNYLDFGGIENVKWYSYLLTFLIVIGTTIIVSLLLHFRVKRIDMNDSLKVNDQ